MDEVFDELFVVSDLHLGGAPGHQEFDQAGVLRALIELIRERPTARRIGLVLNGDAFDFHLEEPRAYFGASDAPEKLRRILDDPVFREVTGALERLVDTRDRRLLLTVGDADIQLALPAVRELLDHVLCGERELPRRRFSIHLDGLGVEIRVGRSVVRCLHGNELDAWSLVESEELRRVLQRVGRRKDSSRRDVPDWCPSPGARLSIDLLSEVKRRFPWIDMLRPAGIAAPLLLSTLAPGMLWSSGRIILGEMMTLRRRARRVRALVGDDRPVNAENEMDMPGPLGMARMWWAMISHREDPVRKVLAGLPSESRLALENGSVLDHDVARAAGDAADFVVAGHSHLERAMPRPAGGMYYNTGTWKRRIRLDSRSLKSDETFDPVYKAFKSGELEALEKIEGLIERRPIVAWIRDTPEGVVGELSRVCVEGGAARLKPLAESRHVVEPTP